LARGFEVILPVHPGFGATELPRHFSTVDDLAYHYLDLLDALDLCDVVLVGVSFGAWIAAEIAIKSTARLSHLVLAGALGVKFGPPTLREIKDIFTVTAVQQQQFLYHAPDRHAPRYTEMDEADLLRVARNREAMQLFGWSPTLFDPKLRQRLHRIDVPTKLLWGAHDRVVPPDYGRAYAAEIPGASLQLVPQAGHYVHVEQPEIVAAAISAFVSGARQSQTAQAVAAD
jgi:pimeloyl-ACP methyl ester carboxylesterase